jgi:isopenicillin-N N-acyltransferase-like protein
VYDYLAPYEELAPHFVEEMHGIARGADLSFEEVLLLNVRDELWGAFKPQPVEHCTSFGCSGEATLSGHPILGQTKDTGVLSKDLYVVTAIYQEGRPDLLQMAYAGELGVFGLGSSGMALLGNSLSVAERPRRGLPLTLFRRLALEAESVADVLALVETHGLATVGNCVVGDRTGRVVALENTGHGVGMVEAEDGILAHANHINHADFRRYEAFEEPELSFSHHRQRRLAEQLEAERGRLTAPMALRGLTDHANYPDSICRHPTAQRDLQTTGAFVVEPALGRMTSIRGLPCQGWPAMHTL